MKENVICGHLIPAGTGLREYEDIIVTSKDDDFADDYSTEKNVREAEEVLND